jgi:multiple sugar transport system substrate-binding protein
MGKETGMAILTRRSLLRNSVGLAAAGALARPYIVNAAATTVETWWNQGFIPEEDAAFRAMVADYEKASGDKIDYSLIPNAPLRQKEISAIQSGVVPDLMEVADPRFTPLNAWSDNLLDLGDLVEPEKSHYSPTALSCCHHYNSTTKQRGYYMMPMKLGTWPFHIWKSLVEKGGAKISDLPNTWDAFLDFFKPVQVKLRAQGMRNVYAYGYQLTGNGYDPVMTYNHFMIAYGGKGFITPDGKLHTDDPKVREAAVKALVTLTTPYKEGYVPPGVVSWNDADDNNAFHSKLMVVDFDGSISTELALYSNKEEYNDILTHQLPLGNDGEKLPAQVVGFGPVIPKGAKKVAAAKEFINYMREPKVLNEYLKGSLGRFAIPMPEIAKSDPFWLNEDPHRTAHTQQALIGPTLPIYEAYNPAVAEVNAEHVFSIAEFDVMNNGMAPGQAIDKAFKRAEAIFAKYQIVQG